MVGSLNCAFKLFNQLLITEGVILYNIIGDVHQFFGNCLIHLDPWMKLVKVAGLDYDVKKLTNERPVYYIKKRVKTLLLRSERLQNLEPTRLY